jgi:hypothetical protein
MTYQIDTLIDIVKVTSLLKEIGLRTGLDSAAIALTATGDSSTGRIRRGAQQGPMHVALCFRIKLKTTVIAAQSRLVIIFILFQKVLDKVACRGHSTPQRRRRVRRRYMW